MDVLRSHLQAHSTALFITFAKITPAWESMKFLSRQGRVCLAQSTLSTQYQGHNHAKRVLQTLALWHKAPQSQTVFATPASRVPTGRFVACARKTLSSPKRGMRTAVLVPSTRFLKYKALPNSTASAISVIFRQLPIHSCALHVMPGNTKTLQDPIVARSVVQIQTHSKRVWVYQIVCVTRAMDDLIMCVQSARLPHTVL